MRLFDSILAAASGKTDATGEANPLMAIVGGLLAQSGGLQGLDSKFAQNGQRNAFQSWVGMGENQSIQRSNSKRAWFRAGQRNRKQNGNRSRSSFGLPG